MLDRVACGVLPPKHHVALRDEHGALRYEECVTRAGFDGPYSILYHVHRPQELEPAPSRYAAASVTTIGSPGSSELLRRHYRTGDLAVGDAPIDSRVPLFTSSDVTVWVLRPRASDASYFINGDGDELFFVRSGSGSVRSVFGDLRFHSGDYVCIPKGTLYRIVWEGPAGDVLLVECLRGVGIPKQWRNELGQLRMDAPYCHRDFRRPEFVGPLDEAVRDVIVKRGGRYHGFRSRHSPLDVVGWDGAVYPWAFPILQFQPRVGAVHLPPTVHGTFEAGGVLVSSFVPRPLDFHPDAIACPYPHASVDVDEAIYYVSGNFSSRNGIEPGSITLHPRGVPHGPHPGRYEAGVGATRTEEVAVMLDCFSPLSPTTAAAEIEDTAYERGISGD